MSLKEKLSLHNESKLTEFLEIDRNFLRRVKKGESSASILFYLIVNEFFENTIEIEEFLSDKDKLIFEDRKRKIQENK